MFVSKNKKCEFLNKSDLELAKLIDSEVKRESEELNLIASENYASPEVLEAIGCTLTNKYAEGYPGKRYYAGCSIIDNIESLAIERCKKLFNAEHANVQPHSGSQANMAVYFSILNPGDTILGMSLNTGGHLTHGHKVNFSGKIYHSVQYSVNQEEYIDYDNLEYLAQKHKPKLIIAGASAYSRIIDFEKISKIAKSINAYFMADIAHIAGLIAAGLHPSPVKHADFVTSTTHKTLRGPRGGLILCKKEYKDIIDRAILPGIQGGPLLNIIAAKAVAFKLAEEPEFTKYQEQVVLNAQSMADEFKKLGYRIVSSGTDNHLFILDLTNQDITGKYAEKLLETYGITVSRSTIPFETKSPAITSGIRIGTPAITTRGCNQEQARYIANLIDQILKNHDNISKLLEIKSQVNNFMSNLQDY